MTGAVDIINSTLGKVGTTFFGCNIFSSFQGFLLSPNYINIMNFNMLLLFHNKHNSVIMQLTQVTRISPLLTDNIYEIWSKFRPLAEQRVVTPVAVNSLLGFSDKGFTGNCQQSWIFKIISILNQVSSVFLLKLLATPCCWMRQQGKSAIFIFQDAFFLFFSPQFYPKYCHLEVEVF